jgi:predicted SAM-dependent methyltransferase
MFWECHQVLRRGGVVRIITLDLSQLLAQYAPTLSPQQQEYLEWMRETITPKTTEPSAVFATHTFLRSWGHHFIYDETTLHGAMQEGCCSDIRRCNGGGRPNPSRCNLANVKRQPEGLL